MGLAIASELGFPGRMHVKVMVDVRGRMTPLEDVSDPRIAGPFRAMAGQVATTLEKLVCPEHGKPPSNVRILVDARGRADLRYDSCCETLGKLIGKALG